MELQLNAQNKKRNGLLLGAIAILLVAMFLFAKKADTADTSSATNNSINSSSNVKGLVARPALTVTVSAAQSTPWDSKLSANGSVAAWEESIIGTELNGVRLVKLLVQVGDQVKRGQLLAQFSQAILATEMAQQNAALAEAEATLADAQSNARRAIQLKESGAISVQQINQYATARNTASAKVSAVRASLQAASLRLQQARVSAPDDGVISSRSATVGAVAQSGQELFRLIRQGRLEWRAEVSAEESTRISSGQTVRLLAVDGSSIQGKVRMVAPTVDPQTRKALVYVDLSDNAANTKNLRPGMFARGEFILGESKALSVPAGALVMRDGYANLFVVDNASQVKQLRVSVGRMQQGRAEIISGLNANARVVDSGAGFLTDGDTVRVVVAATAIPPASEATSNAVKALSGK
ncbi:MAG: efflux RND transporter periplasmic adaptor subunit [Undibacterium sp.]|nr:efflux RND transporter periplasmic adaptor subunit [Undibacterium sp.]